MRRDWRRNHALRPSCWDNPQEPETGVCYNCEYNPDKVAAPTEWRCEGCGTWMHQSCPPSDMVCTGKVLAPTSYAERRDFLSLCLTTAVEGGIGYWAELKDYRWNETDEGDFTDASVYVRDDEMVRGWTKVDLMTISQGIARIRAGKVQINRRIGADVVISDNENDAGEIDSTAADCIVQAALFGELVYG